MISMDTAGVGAVTWAGVGTDGRAAVGAALGAGVEAAEDLQLEPHLEPQQGL